MAKLTNRLKEIRNSTILYMFENQITAEDISLIFGITTSAVYNIIKVGKRWRVVKIVAQRFIN